eukprot:6704123-Pyramimonas_sp.AAC.1
MPTMQDYQFFDTVRIQKSHYEYENSYFRKIGENKIYTLHYSRIRTLLYYLHSSYVPTLLSAAAQELYDKEAEYMMYEWQRQQQVESGVAVPNLPEPEDPKAPKTLSEPEKAERDRLLTEGFSSWSKRDFNNFVRGCERYGREDLDRITLEVEGKTEDEVRDALGLRHGSE